MIIEIVGKGLSVEVEKPITVYYDANIIGKFEATWWSSDELL